ncbi:MAG: trehalose-phosphatase [Gemmatimonadaceae bacterium]
MASSGHRITRSRNPPPPADVNWAWFFDIDGTLVELANAPRGIALDEEMAALIARLHLLSGSAVALVTGRKIEEVDELLPFEELPIAGRHGLELRRNAEHALNGDHAPGRLKPVIDELEKAVARHSDLLLEQKVPCIALHYRNAPRLGGYVHRLMRTLRDRHLPDYVLQKGKLIVELRPTGKDKGDATEEFMHRSPFAGRTPVFVGDDLTDEAAFLKVNEMNGISIKIGPGKTAARFRLRNVSELRNWLDNGIALACK